MKVTRRTVLAGLAATPVLAQEQTFEPSIREISESFGFRFGAAVVATNLDNDKLRGLFERHSALITPQNAMKMNQVCVEPDRNDLAKLDRILGWAERFGAEFRGHPLLFTQKTTMPWLKELAKEDRRLAADKMLRFVGTMARLYGPYVTSFDVVNEPLEPKYKLPWDLDCHWFYEYAGIGGIAEAFAIARDAAPGVELVLNEKVVPYYKFGHPERRDALRRLLAELHRIDAPIDTIGIQSHLTPEAGRAIDASDWRSLLEDIEGMDYRIAITELSVPDGRYEGAHDSRDQAMADATRAYLDMTLMATSVRDVLCWGLSDAHTRYNFLPQEDLRAMAFATERPIRALPFDPGMHRKPMLDAILRAMENAPPRA